MGADYKKKVKDKFKKGLDKAAIEIGTPDLFSGARHTSYRTYEAELVGPCKIKEGETILGRKVSDQLIGYRGSSEVLRIDKLDPQCVEALQNAHHVAKIKIEAIDPVSGIADVSIG